jgi:hypothetical protein
MINDARGLAAAEGDLAAAVEHHVAGDLQFGGDDDRRGRVAAGEGDLAAAGDRDASAASVQLAGVPSPTT